MSRTTNFHECVKSLVKYHNEHGDYDVPTHYVDSDGRNLGPWLYRIKRSYEYGKLTDDKYQALLKVGYDVKAHFLAEKTVARTPTKELAPMKNAPAVAVASATKAAPSLAPATKNNKTSMPSSATKYRPVVDTWDKNYDKLVKFKAEHGHLLPDFNTHKALRMWLNKQRDLWYYGDLDDDRANRLRTLGVPEPDPPSSSEDEDDGTASNSKQNNGGIQYYDGHFAGGQPGDEFAVWDEPGISTRSAKKKRKMEMDDILYFDDGAGADGDAFVAPRIKKKAATTTMTTTAKSTPTKTRAAKIPVDEPPPSFLSCVYQAVSEKVSSFFFSKATA